MICLEQSPAPVRRILSEIFPPFYLYNRLSLFLLSLLIYGLANTVVSVLGMGHPSVLRVLCTRVAAG